MDHTPNHNDQTDEPTTSEDQARSGSITAAIREAAYISWLHHRGPDQQTPQALFDRAYLGHYAAVAAYTEQLVDDYQLDTKLDAAITEPFRSYVDIDVTALSRSLVRNGSLYAIPAAPIGVWVFNGEIG